MGALVGGLGIVGVPLRGFLFNREPQNLPPQRLLGTSPPSAHLLVRKTPFFLAFSQRAVGAMSHRGGRGDAREVGDPHPRGGPHPARPAPGPPLGRVKRRRTKRERDTAKFGRKVPGGFRRGGGPPPRRLLPPWGGRPTASPLPVPKTVVITQNRLCQHRGMFNREVKSVDVERLLSPNPGRDSAPRDETPGPAPEGDPRPEPPRRQGQEGFPAELAGRLGALLGGTQAFSGRDLVGERRGAILAALLHRHRTLPDLSLLLPHRRRGADDAPPGTAAPPGPPPRTPVPTQTPQDPRFPPPRNPISAHPHSIIPRSPSRAPISPSVPPPPHFPLSPPPISLGPIQGPPYPPQTPPGPPLPSQPPSIIPRPPLLSPDHPRTPNFPPPRPLIFPSSPLHYTHPPHQGSPFLTQPPQDPHFPLSPPPPNTPRPPWTPVPPPPQISAVLPLAGHWSPRTPERALRGSAERGDFGEQEQSWDPTPPYSSTPAPLQVIVNRVSAQKPAFSPQNGDVPSLRPFTGCNPALSPGRPPPPAPFSEATRRRGR